MKMDKKTHDLVRQMVYATYEYISADVPEPRTKSMARDVAEMVLDADRIESVCRWNKMLGEDYVAALLALRALSFKDQLDMAQDVVWDG